MRGFDREDFTKLVPPERLELQNYPAFEAPGPFQWAGAYLGRDAHHVNVFVATVVSY